MRFSCCEVISMRDHSERNNGQIRIEDREMHPHLRERMLQRGVTLQEAERTLNDGWEALDAKSGVQGKIMVFPYHEEWEGRTYGLPARKPSTLVVG